MKAVWVTGSEPETRRVAQCVESTGASTYRTPAGLGLEGQVNETELRVEVKSLSVSVCVCVCVSV